MFDYGKLIDEEKTRKDSVIATAEVRKSRDIELVAFFREVEIELGIEMAQANQELKKRGAPVIFGPLRPVRDQEKIELAFGLNNPCCRLTLLNSDPQLEVSTIRIDLVDEAGAVKARMHYVIEGERKPLRAYRSPVIGLPDRSAEVTASEIAQEIVSGIIRGRFV